MLKLILTSVLFSLCYITIPAIGAVPDYYSILCEPQPVAQAAFVPTAKTSPWQPTTADIARGFAAYCVDTSSSLNPDWLWTEPAPPASIDLFVYKGQFRPVSLAVRTMQPLKGLHIVCSDLKSFKGSIIPSEYIDIRNVVYIPQTSNEQTIWTGTWLQKKMPKELPKDYTAWIWLTFHADSKTPQGLYKGSISVSDSSNNVVKLPVKLLVLGFSIQSPKGSYGCFIPSHFNMVTNGIYHNYAEPEYTPSNIGTYFKFWKTRYFNSPTFCHVYPDIKCIDGHAQADYGDLGKMVDAVKKAGLDGDICVDMRFIEWWSSTAANTLEYVRNAGRDTSGDIGIYGPNGWQAETYSKESLRLVEEATLQLLRKADNEKWPRLLMFPEQELAGGGLPLSTFKTFAPVLQKLAPDTTYLVDNSIGYSGMSTDNGDIFKIKIRQYNNWTEEGLAAAKRQGAQVRSYNYGWSRCSWGFLQTRLGSDGYHQWADMWYGGSTEPTWSVTQLSNKGVTPSVDTETAHEGLDDIAYAQTLLSLAKKKGTKYYLEAVRLLDSLVSDIPVNSMIYHPWLSELSNKEFERRRWEIAMAIDELSGRSNYTKGSPGKPAILGTWPIRIEVKKPDKTIDAPRITEKMILDGVSSEKCWSSPKNGTGPLRWLWNTEAQMLATAANQGKDSISSPSSSNAYVAYNADGLYLLAQCNHATLENALAKHSDDDPELWMDDCMEFFFETRYGSNEYYHLTVNVKGNSILLYRSDIIKNSGVKTAQVDLNNGSGGYSQEVFIPWKSLGLDGMPKQGTAWRMNIAREFNSWNQLMSWARVDSMFAEIDKWGMLVFEGEQGKVSLDNLSIGPGFPGKNSISGRITADASWTPTDMTICICDSSDKPISMQNISLEKWKTDPAFAVTFDVPQKATAQTWKMKILDSKGILLGSVPISVKSEKSSVSIIKCPSKVIAGNSLALEIKLNVGDVSLKSSNLEGKFISANGKTIKLPAYKLNVSDYQKVWISTNGLQPGVWSLQLNVKGRSAANAITKIDVLPSPTAQ